MYLSLKKMENKLDFNRKLIIDPNSKRNVVDHLAWMTDEEIITKLDQNKQNLSLLLVNIEYDNNIGNIIRSANAFGVDKVYIYGRKKFDRRGSVGAEFFMRFEYIKFIDEIDSVISNYDNIIAIENNTKSISLIDFKWDYKKKNLIIFGQEQNGIPEILINKSDVTLSIPQIGSVRSLNVATTAGIVMYDYLLKK